jgi:hypothetical protein
VSYRYRCSVWMWTTTPHSSTARWSAIAQNMELSSRVPVPTRKMIRHGSRKRTDRWFAKWWVTADWRACEPLPPNSIGLPGYVNFFLPSFKLQSKIRKGARLSRQYDKPQTPYQRLLASDRVTGQLKARLRQTFAELDPIWLLHRIREAQGRIAQLEIGRAPVEEVPANPGVDQFVRYLATAWKHGEIHATHRKRAAAPRWWRTREDPFEAVWSTVQHWLNEEPDATGKELFQRLQENLPGSFQQDQLRFL